METVELQPDPAVLIRSLRGFPYTIETAVADIVDNSITAGASDIQVIAEHNFGAPRLGILDNGDGMNREELLQAMRLGSRDPSEDRPSGDLGRFGLGLKTASFSQCRRLSVVTRRGESRHVARWDLDHVYSSHQWSVQVPSDPRSVPWADRLGEHGTLVVWEQLDRVIDSESFGEIEAVFNRRIASVAEHLELVFHRFLQGEAGLRRVRISLNGLALKPFDPFHSKHPATISGPVDPIGVAGGSVLVQPFTLPHFSKVSPAEWEKYGGPRGYLRTQGFYLYRAGRLIVHGTWFGLARQTELTKLARVRIDIPNGMDELWKIDVLKASAHPPHIVRQRLRRIVEHLSGTSRRVYQGRGAKLADASRLPMWERTAVHEGVRYGINLDHPTVKKLQESLAGEQAGQFVRLLQLLSASLPIDSLIVDLGDRPHEVRGAAATDEAVEQFVRSVGTQLREAGLEWDHIRRSLKASEIAGGDWPLSCRILESLEQSERD